MKNLTFFLILFSFFLTNFSHAQYAVGIAVNDTIYTGNFHSLGENCFPDPDVTIEVDAPLLPYVSGLDLKMIIAEINAPVGSVSTDEGELSVGDTLAINAETSIHSFYFSEGGDFHFIILATGVPEVEAESYPCALMEFISQPICQVGYVIVADEYIGECVVEEGEIVSTIEEQFELQFLCFPNPTNSIFNVQNDSKLPIQNITILDVHGQKIDMHSDVNSFPFQIDLSTFSSGLYFIQIQTSEFQIIKKMLKI